jgi:hypothetical protein
MKQKAIQLRFIQIQPGRNHTSFLAKPAVRLVNHRAIDRIWIC